MWPHPLFAHTEPLELEAASKTSPECNDGLSPPSALRRGHRRRAADSRLPRGTAFASRPVAACVRWGRRRRRAPGRPPLGCRAGACGLHARADGRASPRRHHVVPGYRVLGEVLRRRLRVPVCSPRARRLRARPDQRRALLTRLSAPVCALTQPKTRRQKLAQGAPALRERVAWPRRAAEPRLGARHAIHRGGHHRSRPPACPARAGHGRGGARRADGRRSPCAGSPEPPAHLRSPGARPWRGPTRLLPPLIAPHPVSLFLQAEPHILLFRRPQGTDPTASCTASASTPPPARCRLERQQQLIATPWPSALISRTCHALPALRPSVGSLSSLQPDVRGRSEPLLCTRARASTQSKPLAREASIERSSISNASCCRCARNVDGAGSASGVCG